MKNETDLVYHVFESLGIVLAVRSQIVGVHIGVSVCSTADCFQWDEDLGRRIARGRAIRVKRSALLRGQFASPIRIVYNLSVLNDLMLSAKAELRKLSIWRSTRRVVLRAQALRLLKSYGIEIGFSNEAAVAAVFEDCTPPALELKKPEVPEAARAT